MNAKFPWTTRLLIAVTTFALCGGPEFASAQAQDTTAPAATATTDTATQQQTPAADTSAQPAANAAPADQNATQVPAQNPQTADPNAPARPGSMLDPAAGPLQPVPSTSLPNAPSSTQQDQTAQPAAPASSTATTPTRPQEREPLGTATAEGGRTVGGAASRPAGNAIAPAKQRQVRSFLIKLGAIAGAGIAIGTVYALSKGTSSTPPNAASGNQR
jgi:hypothetical protein